MSRNELQMVDDDFDTIHQSTCGQGSAGLGEGICICDELDKILRDQGLSREDFLLAAQSDPTGLSDFVYSMGSIRH